jgi:hypothetical protein
VIAAPVLPAQSTTLVTDHRAVLCLSRARVVRAYISFSTGFFAAARKRVAVTMGGKLTRLCLGRVDGVGVGLRSTRASVRRQTVPLVC